MEEKLEDLLQQQKELQSRIEAAKARQAQSAQGKIAELVQQAHALISEAEQLAITHNLEFEFSLGYGQGGTFNATDWDSSADDNGNYPRSADWKSSSSRC